MTVKEADAILQLRFFRALRGWLIERVDTLHAPTRSGGLLLVLSGPSGVGKDTLLARLCELGEELHKCVTATTRAPRGDEVDGVSYLFHNSEDFRKLIAAGELLEFARVHGHYYGTPKQAVLDALAEGVDVVLNIDVQGGVSVKRAMPEAILIYVAPPSSEELERRLRDRETDSEESIKLRFKNARSEALSASLNYDYQIINDDLAEAAERLRAILVAERCRIVRQTD